MVFALCQSERSQQIVVSISTPCFRFALKRHIKGGGGHGHHRTTLAEFFIASATTHRAVGLKFSTTFKLW